MLSYGFLIYIFWKTSYKQRAFYLQKKKKNPILRNQPYD